MAAAQGHLPLLSALLQVLRTCKLRMCCAHIAFSSRCCLLAGPLGQRYFNAAHTDCACKGCPVVWDDSDICCNTAMAGGPGAQHRPPQRSWRDGAQPGGRHDEPRRCRRLVRGLKPACVPRSCYASPIWKPSTTTLPRSCLRCLLHAVLCKHRIHSVCFGVEYELKYDRGCIAGGLVGRSSPAARSRSLRPRRRSRSRRR